MSDCRKIRSIKLELVPRHVSEALPEYVTLGLKVEIVGKDVATTQVMIHLSDLEATFDLYLKDLGARMKEFLANPPR